MFHHNTTEAITRTLYYLDKEPENAANPIIEVLEKALEYAKDGVNFADSFDLLTRIESDLTEEELANDRHYYDMREQEEETRQWLAQII